jgi:hypothetical protein
LTGKWIIKDPGCLFRILSQKYFNLKNGVSHEDRMRVGKSRLRGNSGMIARYFCSKIESLGGRVEAFALNKLSCRGCRACKTNLSSSTGSDP